MLYFRRLRLPVRQEWSLYRLRFQSRGRSRISLCQFSLYRLTRESWFQFEFAAGWRTQRVLRLFGVNERFRSGALV